jgi:myo-inositol-1(or 4)-monophosphatase
MDELLQIDDEYLHTAFEAARRAVHVARSRPGATDTTTKGAAADIVTETDKQIERETRAFLSERHPTHGVIGEEYENDPTADANWIIDPIDGTSNYYHEVFPSCTLIALELNNELHAAVTWMHAADDVYYAVAGHGAYHNDTRLSVNASAALEDVIVSQELTEHDLKDGDTTFIDFFHRLQLTGGGVRKHRCGGYNFTKVADGGYGATVMGYMGLWDIAAGSLLVREAGGTVTTLDGDADWETIRTTNHGLIASNGTAHDALLDIWESVN